MRLQELFLIETTEEDRAIISLAYEIDEYLADQYGDDYSDTEIEVGTIGDLFDTPIPILNPITIILDTPDGIAQRVKDEYPDDVSAGNEDVAGIWYSHNKTLILNINDVGSFSMQSTISHELRHALDDFKSGFKANRPETPDRKNSYLRPKNKDHRKNTYDPYFGDIRYLAEPAEINARFVEVLNQMVDTINTAMRLPPEKIKPVVMQEFKNALRHFQIADLFPEKEKSKDYKRLIKRGVDFIDKELAYKTSKK